MLRAASSSRLDLQAPLSAPPCQEGRDQIYRPPTEDMAGQYLGPSQATTEHPWHRPNQPIGEDNPTERRVAHYKHCGPMRPDEPFRLQQHHNTDHHPSSTSSPEAEDGAKQHLHLPLRRLAPGCITRRPTSHPPHPCGALNIVYHIFL